MPLGPNDSALVGNVQRQDDAFRRHGEGRYALNPDGSPVLDENGFPIPASETGAQADVDRYRNLGDTAQQRMGPQIDYSQANAQTTAAQWNLHDAALARQQQQGAIGEQQGAANLYRDAAMGGAPSAAVGQMQMGADAAMHGQLGAMAGDATRAGARGAAGLASAQQAAASNLAGMQMQNAAQGGAARAQEIAGARGGYMGATGALQQGVGQMRMGDYASAGERARLGATMGVQAQAQAAQDMRQRALNDQSQMGYEKLGYDTNNAELQARMAYQDDDRLRNAHQTSLDQASNDNTRANMIAGATALTTGGASLSKMGGAADGGGDASADGTVHSDRNLKVDIKSIGDKPMGGGSLLVSDANLKQGIYPADNPFDPNVHDDDIQRHSDDYEIGGRGRVATNPWGGKQLDANGQPQFQATGAQQETARFQGLGGQASFRQGPTINYADSRQQYGQAQHDAMRGNEVGAQQMGVLGQQQQATGMYRAAAMGASPSIAQQTMGQGAQSAIASQQSMAQTARGPAALAAAGYNAAGNIAGIQQQNAGQQQILRAQEMEQGRAGYAQSAAADQQAAAGIRQQDVGAAGMRGGWAQQMGQQAQAQTDMTADQRSLNDQRQLGYEGLGYGVDDSEMKARMAFQTDDRLRWQHSSQTNQQSLASATQNVSAGAAGVGSGLASMGTSQMGTSGAGANPADTAPGGGFYDDPSQNYGDPNKLKSDATLKSDIKAADVRDRPMGSPPPENTPVDKFLGSLNPVQYKYKAGVPGENTHDERYGIIAQDVASTPMGKSLVEKTPIGLAINVPHATGALMAGAGHLYARQQELEAELARLKARK